MLPGGTGHSAARSEPRTLSRLAQNGLIYNRFHVTAVCSPTRAALLTGRNHHRVPTQSSPARTWGSGGQATQLRCRAFWRA